MLSREFFHQLEDTITRDAYEINEKYHMGDYGFRSILRPAPRQRVETIIPALTPTEPEYTPQAFVNVTVATQDIKVETKVTMVSPIDRIKQKALEARAVAPQALKDFESDLDGILREKEVLAQKRTAAVTPHKEAIAGIYGEFDGLKSAMDILTNGGPSLDPLEESDTSAPGS